MPDGEVPRVQRAGAKTELFALMPRELMADCIDGAEVEIREIEAV